MIIMNFAYLTPDMIMGISAAVAGIAVTVGAGFAVYYHKIKKKVSDKLGIDEESKKEVEEDVTGNFGE